MDSLITKKAFAEKAGIRPQELTTYLKRGNVVASGNKIDLNNEVNKEFLIKRAEILNDEPETEDEEESLTKLEKQIKKLTIVKIGRENQLKQVQIDRFSGVLIPTELVKLIFIQHNKVMLTALHQALDNSLVEIAAVKSMSSKEVATVRGSLIKILNKSMSDSVAASLKGVENIVDEYSQSRLKGERKN